jgi:hypothetical protein
VHRQWFVNIPLDSEASHTRLLGKNIPANAVNNRLSRGIGDQLLRVVLVVDIVSDTNKLAAIVAASEKNDGHTQDLGGRDALQVGGIGLEDELVHSNGNGTDEKRVEFLVIFRTGIRVSSVH